MNIISEIELWYKLQCNSIWEHHYGISIQTIDNPGWEIKINLTGTPYSDLGSKHFRYDRSDVDWIDCKIENGVFYAYGGPMNLGEMLEYFIKTCKLQG